MVKANLQQDKDLSGQSLFGLGNASALHQSQKII